MTLTRSQSQTLDALPFSSQDVLDDYIHSPSSQRQHTPEHDNSSQPGASEHQDEPSQHQDEPSEDDNDVANTSETESNSNAGEAAKVQMDNTADTADGNTYIANGEDEFDTQLELVDMDLEHIRIDEEREVPEPEVSVLHMTNCRS